jgi:hypothetical protein
VYRALLSFLGSRADSIAPGKRRHLFVANLGALYSILSDSLALNSCESTGPRINAGNTRMATAPPQSGS